MTQATEPSTPRLGLSLFGVYLLFYAGFMALNVISPMAMQQSLGVTNVAIAYGFGLIVAAVVFAGLYVFLCSRPRRPGNPT